MRTDRPLPRFLILLGLAAVVALAQPGCGGKESASEEDPELDDRAFLEDKLDTYRFAARGPTALHFDVVPEAGGITAVNHSGRSGVKEYLVEAVGVGPCWLDYDGDGLMDVYVPDGDVFSNYELTRETDGETGRLVPRLTPKDPRPEPFRDQLWHNLGNGRFENVADAAGVADDHWSFGSTAFDYDADGDPDIFVANFGANRLYRNNGNGTFTDIAPAVGLSGQPWQWSTCAAVGDIDGDGRLDIYVAAYSDPAAEVERQRLDRGLPESEPVEAISGRACRWRGIRAYCGPIGLEAQDDQVFVQQADGTFRDMAAELGLRPRAARYGFTTLMYDFNEDGRLDVYVANDSVENFMFEQDGKAGKIHLTDTSDILGVKFARNLRPQASMGAAVADVNQDGIFDLFVTNFSHDYNNLWLGQKTPGGDAFFFKDRGLQVMGQQVYYDLSWGCGWQDFDNDGDLDLYVANGHVYKETDLLEKTRAEYEQLNALFECLDAPAMEFREVGLKAQQGAPAGKGIPVQNLDAGPGLAVKTCTRGAAFCDFDNDGRMDVLLQNMNEAPTLLHNTAPRGDDRRWVKLSLHQSGQNAEALGAVIEVTSGGRRQRFPVLRCSSFLGGDDPRVHVGLGSEATCDVRVLWPGKEASTEYRGLGAGRHWRLDRDSGQAEALPLPEVDLR